MKSSQDKFIIIADNGFNEYVEEASSISDVEAVLEAYKALEYTVRAYKVVEVVDSKTYSLW